MSLYTDSGSHYSAHQGGEIDSDHQTQVGGR